MAHSQGQTLTSETADRAPAILPLASGDLSVVVGGFSCPGVKGNNDDAFTVNVPEQEADRRLKGIVGCIADGISSSAKSHIASQTAVVQFAQDYYSTPDTWRVREAGVKVIEGINRWLLAHGDQDNRQTNGLVTTFSGIVLRSHTAHIFHAGDTRVYLYRNEEIEQLTQDHRRNVAFQEDLLTAALGLDRSLRLDYREERLHAGDLFILLTDGVHAHVSDTQLVDFIKRCEVASRTDLEHSAQKLCKLAKEAGSEDDLSCLLICISDLTVEGVDEAHQRLSLRAIPPLIELGKKIDGFVVVRVLHSGTRSIVYLVRNERDGQNYVLKAPSQNFAEDLRYLEGFHREQWVGSRFNDPGLLRIGKPTENSDFLYHLSEYVEGPTLRQWINDHPEPSINAVRDIIGQLIRVVRLLHRNGIVHRDLKPENIIVPENGGLKLIDFGTVQISGLDELTPFEDAGPPQGSVDYIAPETLLGQRANNQSDLFSIGCIAYEMLTGRPPYQLDPSGTRWPKTYAGWRYPSVRQMRSDIPRWVDAALEKCLAPDPKSRYRAMSEFEEDLRRPGAYARSQEADASLYKKNPLLFWKTLSLILVFIVITQWLLAHMN